MWRTGLPRWVVMIRYIEYRDVIRMFRPVRMIEKFDHENIVIVISSSPNKLIDGGRARLARLAIIHQAVIRGRIDCRPRVKIIVRLWVRS